MKFLIMQSSPVSRHFFFLGPNIVLSTLFPSLCETDQVSHPYNVFQHF